MSDRLSFRPPVTLHSWQLEAIDLIEARLERFGGALFCDPPGSGKSWVAAEIARRYRYAGLPVEVVVPRALASDWRRLLERFEVDLVLHTHDETIPSDTAAHLVIVDEAHRFRNRITRRTSLLARHAVRSRLLLVTATPVWNTAADLATLLRLFLADDALHEHGIASIDMAILRAPDDLARAAVHALVVRRALRPVAVDVRDSMLLFRSVSDSASLRRAVKSLRFPLATRSATPRSLLCSSLIRRGDSSAAALEESIGRLIADCEAALQETDRHPTLQRAEQQELFAIAPKRHIDPALMRSEIDLLQTVLAVIGRRDPKQQTLLELLRREPSEATIVFTNAIATARELHRLLDASCGPAGLLTSRCSLLPGGREAAPSAVVDAFDAGLVRFLVATDVGSEGLNLQRGSRVIHYDLPWTSVRVEQRNGRVLRIGQTAERIEIIRFVPARRSGRVASETIARKSRLIRRTFRRTVSLPSCARLLPPRIAPGSDQAALFSILRRRRMTTRAIAADFGRSWRFGIELTMREVRSRGASIALVRSLLRLMHQSRVTDLAGPAPRACVPPESRGKDRRRDR